MDRKRGQRLEGNLPIFPIPFDNYGDVDYHSIDRLIEFLLWGRVDGITLLANASEGFALSDYEKDKISSRVLEAVNKRIPVVVTVNHYSTRIAIEKAKRAQQEGATAVMAMPPFFGTMAADPKGIYEFYNQLGESIEIPLILQDDQVLSGVQLTPEYLSKMVRDTPNLEYIKLESPQAPYKISRIKELLGDAVSIFAGMGSITFLEALERGACGTMSSAALLELGTIYSLYRQGEYNQARSLFYKVLPFIVFEIHLAPRNITKEVLWMARIIASPAVRHPGPASYDDQTRAQLKRLLQDLGLRVFNFSSN
ncbi:L-2-keto-3-deoxyarabonate dehydratase [Moorella thermoacetica]|uniref:L-2-keto-3-deoxyarabonate dehydratase n=1 Tax=Neomoorella thermoacetica TaxID=1525 RepID=A0AAC9HJN0_NEOTH|nr:dihydrodipicolinate synthase family protein [Moorella thermoacetica]AOQ25105.1 L-2-keto-3-deoxyarabonate dehydratase [Moorella thermoacetica]TYL15364.1 L-2-keto-3-deoxyarabonate dehydratase [Moorella thermoacetica]